MTTPGGGSPGDVAGVLRGMLPSTVVVATARLAEAAGPLHPAEAAAVARAVPARRHEFALGRTLARRALADLGVPPGPIPVGVRRSPSWPAGVVASISHGGDWVVVVAARAEDVTGLGVDVEPVSGGVSSTLVHSAREAAFKAWFPVTGRWLEPSGVSVRVDGASWTADTGDGVIGGAWAEVDGLVVSVAVLGPPAVSWSGPVGPEH